MRSYNFHPAVAQWFESRFGTPTEPQAAGWPAIQSGRHALISAPTGSGKTLAAFLAALNELFSEGASSDLPDETRVLYVSPLRALSNDIRKNLQEPLNEIRQILLEQSGRDVDVRVQVRTGDTPASERQAIAKRPPHILVTTPESFYLLLTSESGRRVLKTVRTLIVDEIHAVVDERRGAHLALSMERLVHLTGQPLQRIGLSATQRPIEEVAHFLTGAGEPLADCAIINTGHRRQLDLALELPGSPLEAVMSAEVWAEVYRRLAALIEAHRTTLVFVNTRRMAERVTQHLGELLGKEKVTSHHGSLSAALRLDAEDRLKRGELKALVATASLELGIDIGSVDLVCQLGSTRSISKFLQRVGRAEHKRGGLPKGRLFPLSRDEMAESAALLRSISRGELDLLSIPEKPLDVLAQQIVAAAASEDLDEAELYEVFHHAWPYRNLTRDEFDRVVQMLATGFSTKRGRRAALLHHDAVNHRLRGRRGSRILALTSGGAIPDNAEHRVVLEPSETFIGTVNEDFAIESLPGDIFQLGNASWKILRVNSGQVRVEDAHGQPPSIPFWLGEAPGRTNELSDSLSSLREEIEAHLAQGQTAADLTDWLVKETGIPATGAMQLAVYFSDAFKALGVLPSRHTLVMERFFDESGGMQLVIHSPFGARINRAWGLALRKRFCRSFNFELQAAATDDAIVLSLGTQHSFPLDEVFRYLNSKTVRGLLVQALLDAPMFTIRWRWNASRALAVPRHRGGHRLAAPLQRMESENLLAAVFPDQLACLENIAGDREVPDHPLVNQTIDDCLTEAMDIDGLEELLRGIESGKLRCVARDLPEPSPLAHEILSARPYAFLDDAPLEERRAHAVYTRRAMQGSSDNELGILDAAAIERVTTEAWPSPRSADELHEALLLLGAMTEAEMDKAVTENSDSTSGGREMLETLVQTNRVGRIIIASRAFWVAAEEVTMLQAIYPDSRVEPVLTVPETARLRTWQREEAIREVVRGRLEFSGPLTTHSLAEVFGLQDSEVEVALLGLESEGFVLRGKFHPGATDTEWCERRLLARIHRQTINRLRSEIQPVSIQDYLRFLLEWQHLAPEQHLKGPEGLSVVLEQFEAYEAPVAAWEPEIILSRVPDYEPDWLNHAGFSGQFGWGRLTPPKNQNGRPAIPLRTSSISFFSREHMHDWLELTASVPTPELGGETKLVFSLLENSGALFFAELVRKSGLLPSQVEQSLIELIGAGLATADSYDGVRALLLPSDKRPTFGRTAGRRHHKKNLASIEFAGRWWLLERTAARAEHKGSKSSTPQVADEVRQQTLNPHPVPLPLGKGEGIRQSDLGAFEALDDGSTNQSSLNARVLQNQTKVLPLPFIRGEGRGEGSATGVLHHGPESSLSEPKSISHPGDSSPLEKLAWTLLRRYGVVFRRILERESIPVSWYELGKLYRSLEARGLLRGGHFVSGVGGEQFALPEGITSLRAVRKSEKRNELVAVSGADPLNLLGILAPGPRLPSIVANRLLFRDGLPIATFEGGEVHVLVENHGIDPGVLKTALTVHKLPAPLRPYY